MYQARNNKMDCASVSRILFPTPTNRERMQSFILFRSHERNPATYPPRLFRTIFQKNRANHSPLTGGTVHPSDRENGTYMVLLQVGFVCSQHYCREGELLPSRPVVLGRDPDWFIIPTRNAFSPLSRPVPTSRDGTGRYVFCDTIRC